MNGLLLVLFGGLAAAVIFAYLGGRQAGLGRGEQDRGDLAEENTTLRKYVGGLEERVTAQHHRIVAMTAWETVPWPDGRTSPVPVRPEAQPVPAAALKVVPRPRRERRTSTAAFLDPPPETCGQAVPDEKTSSGPAVLPAPYRGPCTEADRCVMHLACPLHDACAAASIKPETPAPSLAGCDCPPDLCPHTQAALPEVGWWRELEDEIWSAKLWLAGL